MDAAAREPDEPGAPVPDGEHPLEGGQGPAVEEAQETATPASPGTPGTPAAPGTPATAPGPATAADGDEA